MAGRDKDLSNESSRRNGWSLPLHLLQVCGWVAVIYFMLIYFSTMVPVLPSHWQPAAYIVSLDCCGHHALILQELVRESVTE